MSRKVQVKNRAPAPIQITAEQILREANDRVVKEDKAPRVHITDPEELIQVCRCACVCLMCPSVRCRGADQSVRVCR